MIRKIKTFFGEVRAELARATWPWDPKEKGLKKYRELIDSTGIVLIAMLIMGAFVSLNDFFLINAVSAFTRTDLSARRVVEVPTPGSASLPPEAALANQPEIDPNNPAVPAVEISEQEQPTTGGLATEDTEPAESMTGEVLSTEESSPQPSEQPEQER